MTEEPKLTNPESAFHYNQIDKERKKLRRHGYISLAACAGVLICGPVLFFLTPNKFENLLSLFFLIYIPLSICVFVFAGWWGLREGKKPITLDEVGDKRRFARQQLMKQAQGEFVPFAYRMPASILKGVLGILMLLCALFLLFAGFLLTPMSLIAIVTGSILLLFALSFLFNAFFIAPAMRKRLSEESANELATRLKLGESTQGYNHEP